MTRFIQFHFLTSYPAALLNRDDAGLAKRIPYGGATRTRISSQCLKRHWRTWTGADALADLEGEDAMSVRSRLTFERFLYEPLVDEGVAPDMAEVVTAELRDLVLGAKSKAEAKKDKKDSAKDGSSARLHTGQVTVLGRREMNYLLEQARSIVGGLSDLKDVKKAVKDLAKDREFKKNLTELALGAGLDAALFGRMVTSDILARCDAAVHVAHAFTVHEEEVEADYFSAVDDLLAGDDELGSGHIGSVELTSGLYYGYVVVDVPLLIDNLSGDRQLAGKVVASLAGLVTRVSPGAKLGSTAPYGYAQAFVAEAGSDAPRSLAAAFLDPIPTQPGMLAKSIQRLGEHLVELDRAYPPEDTERVVFGVGVDELRDKTGARGDVTSLPAVRDWLVQRIASTN